MKFPKSLVLTTAAFSIASAIGFAYSQTSTETPPPPPTTGSPTMDARPADSTLPGNQESAPQSTGPQSSEPTAADSTSTTPSGDSAAMGSEQVARADRH